MTLTTLTREALLSKAKPRYEVVDVPGVGQVGIRSVSEVRASQREARMFDDNGNYVKDFETKVRAWAFIDQLMVDEKTPMFEESDLASIQQMDKAVTRPLYQAIKEFNREDSIKKKGDSKDTSES